MTNHIQALYLEAFRGIRQLTIENLGDVNIIVGDNNTGKTSVLEAIQLICNPSIYNLIKIAKQREKYKATIRMGLGNLESILYLFDVKSYKKEENNYYLSIGGTIKNRTGNVRITGKVIDQLIDMNELSRNNPAIKYKREHALVEIQKEIPTFVGNIENEFFGRQISLFPDIEQGNFEINDYTRFMSSNKENPLLNVHSVQVIDHVTENVFDNLIRNKSIKEKAVDLLKEFDQSITDIRYISDDNKFVPVIENSNHDYIPLSLYGDGMKKALTMLKAIVNAENGVVLIDEFETALHTSAMKRVFAFLLEISKKFDVQLFLTTHSIEAVDKLLESAGSEVDNVKVIRLKKKDGITLSKVTSGKEALEDRKEYNMELRI